MSEPQPLPRPHLDMLDTVPLFMRELPSVNASDAPESDANTLAALQSLIYDEPPEEIASNFKDQGNDYFKGRRFQGQEGGLRRVPIEDKDRPLYNALLLNRAAANLELENYGQVLKDVHIVLEYDPKSSKALFRAARALIKLRRYEEAVDACDRCLMFDPNNKDVEKTKEIAAKGLEEELRRTYQRQQAAEREKSIKVALETALKYHGITVLRTPNDNVEPESLPQLDPPLPSDPTTAELVCRVALVYPQYAQTDLIIRFSTYDTLGAHLDTILPDPSSSDGQLEYPPWDIKKEYTSRGVNVYVQTKQGRVLKLGRNKTLGDICANVRTTGKAKGLEDGLVVGQGVIAFVVVPRASEAEDRYLKSVREGNASK
ncbi:TPR-1 domain protein [Ceratobasidium sp. AG-Ba]|nr:TPR-1 domain protein [Ceratobasidium sp. AG-Ba]